MRSAFELLDPHFATPGSDVLLPAFFLDFDGTLARIVDRPQDAQLERPTRRVLEELVERFPCSIVSGRALEDLRARVGVNAMSWVGCHGFEIDAPFEPELTPPAHDEVAVAIAQAAEFLEPEVRRIPGAVLEQKPFALTLHYRLVNAADVQTLRTAVSRALLETPHLRQASGKKILELRPRICWGKGDAIRAIWTALERNGSRYRPFVFGDDLTDEDGFRAVQPVGHSIFVGRLQSLRRATSATHCLASPEEVTAFLRAVIETSAPIEVSRL